jgi:hypothetical protein
VTESASTPGEWDRARVERLARTIGEELRTQTYSQAPVADVNVEEWRQAARLAGRRLGLRVRTEVRYGYVHVRAIDVPLPEWVRERAQRSLDARARSLLGDPAQRDG